MSSTRDAPHDGGLRFGARFALLSAASLIAVALLASWWRRCVRFRRLELAIAGPRSLPLVGNALGMVGVSKDNTLDIILKLWGGRYGGLSRMSILNTLIVFVTDAKHIKQVLSDRRLLDKPDYFYEFLATIIGHRGLVTAKGELWRAHRTAVLPTFKAEVLEGFQDIFSAEAMQFVEKMRPALGRDTEYTKNLSFTTGKAVMQTLMTLTEEDEAKLEVLVGSHMPRALEIMTTRALKPWLWPSAIFDHTQIGKEAAGRNRFIYNFIEGSIQRTAQGRAKATESKLEGSQRQQRRKSFADLMLEAQRTETTAYTNSQIVEEVLTVFGAAVETTATALTYIFKLLSMYPDVQQRVYGEVHDVLGDGDWHITGEDLARLTYTERVIKQVMRMFPSVPFIGRDVPVDIELDGKTIPAGSALCINIFGAHRNLLHYPDPLRFDPDRFLHERLGERPYGSYLPFSAGPRNCIGRTYAMRQMKTVLATTLRAYELLPAADGYVHPSQFPLTWDLSLVFVGGARIRFEPMQ